MAPHWTRSVFLALMLTALLAQHVAAQASTTTTTITVTNTTAAPPSFCELCRDKGNCAQAYKGSPGIFCGAWLNGASQRLACCCPSNGQCAKTPSNYECLCQSGPTTKPAKSAAASNGVAFATAAAAVVFAAAANV